MKKVMPKTLTAKEWEAKKGTVAKMAGETGMGAALKKLDAAWAKVPEEALDPDTALATAKLKATEKNVQGLMEKVKTQMPKIEATRKELVAVRDLAATLAKDWGKSKIIPKTSTAYATQIAKDADQMYIALKSFDLDWRKLLATAKAKDERDRAAALKSINVYFSSLPQYGDEVKQTPTVSTYIGSGTKGFHQNVRGLSAALTISGDPQLVAFKSQVWNAFAQDTYKPKGDDEVLPKVSQVLKALDQLKGLVK